MSVENQYLGRDRDAIEAFRLVQHGHLQKAQRIKDPTHLSPTRLLQNLMLAKTRCDIGNHTAIALNEIDPLLYRTMGIDQLQNAVYFFDGINDQRGRHPFRGYLLINPELRILSREQILRPEACGSVLDGQVGMFVKLPKIVSVTGHLWKPDYEGPVQVSQTFSDNAAALLVHESRHLNGQTAINFPDTIVDFREISLDPQLKDILNNWWQKWLIFDQRLTRFYLLDPRGEVVGYPNL